MRGPIGAGSASSRCERRTLLLFLLSLAVLAFLNSPFFRLADVQIEGNRILSESEIRAALPLAGRPNLFHIDAQQIEDALRRLPPIRAARVRRIFPRRLLIEVVEREPVLLVEAGETVWAVDRSGVAFRTFAADRLPPLPAYPLPPGVPVLAGRVPGDPSLTRAAQLAAVLPQELRVDVTRIRPEDGEFVLTTRSGTVILWGTLADSERKARVLEALQKQAGGPFAQIDIRNPAAPATRRN